jgi:hypothetical protein
MVEDEESRNKNAVDGERYQLEKKTKNRKPTKPRNQPCTKYFHISTKPIRLHRMLPPSASPMYTSPFQHRSKGKKRKKKTHANISFNARRD